MPRFGLIAQLGERCVRNAEVEGSIPFGSTISVTGRTWEQFGEKNISSITKQACDRRSAFYYFRKKALTSEIGNGARNVLGIA